MERQNLTTICRLLFFACVATTQVIASPYDDTAPPNGISVVFPALEQETPRYPSSNGFSPAVDLVVVGTARVIGDEDKSSLYEIIIEKVLFGSYPHKTIRVEEYLPDKERRIYGLAGWAGHEYVHDRCGKLI